MSDLVMDEKTEGGLRVVQLRSRPRQRRQIGPFDESARRTLFAFLVATVAALLIGGVAITLAGRMGGDHEAITLPAH